MSRALLKPEISDEERRKFDRAQSRRYFRYVFLAWNWGWLFVAVAIGVFATYFVASEGSFQAAYDEFSRVAVLGKVFLWVGIGSLIGNWIRRSLDWRWYRKLASRAIVRARH